MDVTLSKHKKVIGSFVVILLLVMLLYVTYTIATDSLESQDSSAIVGGSDELGYEFVGFVLSQISDSEFYTCGMAHVRDDLAITAAHCVENNADVFVGFGTDLNDTDALIKSKEVIIPNYNENNVSSDFALIAFTQAEAKYAIGTITEPTVGCNYIVVGYGQGESNESNDLADAKRKSTQVCIQSVDEKTFTIEGVNGGICFGDSGSPVIEKDTKNVVGVISMIVYPEKQDPCYIGNQGIVVRADQYKSYVSGTDSQSDDQEDVGIGNLEEPDPSGNQTTDEDSQDDSGQFQNSYIPPANANLQELNAQSGASLPKSARPSAHIVTLESILFLFLGVSFMLTALLLSINSKRKAIRSES